MASTADLSKALVWLLRRPENVKKLLPMCLGESVTYVSEHSGSRASSEATPGWRARPPHPEGCQNRSMINGSTSGVRFSSVDIGFAPEAL